MKRPYVFLAFLLATNAGSCLASEVAKDGHPNLGWLCLSVSMVCLAMALSEALRRR